MAVKLKQSGFVNSESLYEGVNDIIIEMTDEGMFDSRMDEDVADKLGFVPFYPTVKDGQITTKLGIKPAPLVGELDQYTLSEKSYGPKISYDVVRTFPASKITSEASKWLKVSKGDTEMPTAVRADIQSSFGNLADEVNSIKLAEADYILKCWTEGFGDVTADFGPGSAVYDGRPLFSNDHRIISNTDEKYSNIISVDDTTHAPLTFESLKKAVSMLRGMKDGQGIRVARPAGGIYDLYVSPELEGTALDVLSDGNNFMPYTYTGADANNNNFTNIFSTRDGFKVRLNVIENLNLPDQVKGGNATIGSETMWFVVNKELARKREAFRKIIFGDVEIEISEDPNTKATVATAEKFFGAQVLYPEVIVGSLGDGSQI